MRTRFAVALTCCIMLAAIVAYAQGDEGYQPAQIVSFEKVPSNEQHPENADHYKVAMRMGGAVYLCTTSGPIATFMSWSPGKEFPAKLDGKKTMLVKTPDGQVVQLTINKVK